MFLHIVKIPLALFILIAFAATTFGAGYAPSSETPPKPVREFRGAWIASVANINWPSRKGLSTAEQKAEFIAILDRAQKLKLNALIFQVRPACDALYDSKIEPWSEYMSGKMGQPPQPYYDPLEFAVSESHKRGLELHAWFNPYRARLTTDRSTASANHISHTRPELVRQYGKHLWLDPGEKAVQDYSLSVVMDVVKRYDIDGVHFDDYFYPYQVQEAGKDVDFPDEASWKKYGAGGKLSRDDWRRENVNVFIQRVYQSIKSTKPTVKFGVSPFGIWRPGEPAQIKGYDAYAKLYADSRKWIQNGWLDYFAPQLYWPTDQKEQSYPVLLSWWTRQNPKSRHIWPGLNTVKALGSWKAEEIPNQIRLSRQLLTAPGHIHWSMRGLRDPMGENLLNMVYSEPALIPAMPWLDKQPPAKPSLSVSKGAGNSASLSWTPSGNENVSLWLLQTKTNEKWSTLILPAHSKSHTFAAGPSIIALSAVDRAGNASPTTVVKHK